MNGVAFPRGVSGADAADAARGAEGKVSSPAVVPPAGGSGTGGTPGSVPEVPSLPAPKMELSSEDLARAFTVIMKHASVGALSLEQLAEALGVDARQLAVKQGTDSIRARGKEVEGLHKEKLQEIHKQLEELEKKNKLSPLKKFFKWFGLVAGLVASLVVGVVGVATGQPLLIAGAVIGVAMSINSIVSEATEGKYSLGAAFAAGINGVAKLFGKELTEEQKKIAGMVFEITLSLVGVFLSVGGAVKLASSAKDITQAAATIMKLGGYAGAFTSILGGAVHVGSGVVTMVSAGYDKAIGKSKVSEKELEAALQLVEAAFKSDEKLVEAVLEHFQKLVDAVKDAIDGNMETLGTILSGHAPAMA
ncbi:MAG: type III secretion system translocon subunit SctE [Desulfovibrio sp.]|jgi:hypothetical protein|nr:type III secretion system translocon subunit SctE [Desulfovibrio sp.]